jgi:hypothetical protein
MATQLPLWQASSPGQTPLTVFAQLGGGMAPEPVLLEP